MVNPYRTSTATPTSNNPWQVGYDAGRRGAPNLYGSNSPANVDLFARGYREGAEVRAATPLRTRFEAVAAATPRATRTPSLAAHAFLAGASRAARGERGLFAASTPALNQAFAAGYAATERGEVLRDPRTTYGVLGRGFRVRPPDWESLREAARFAQRQP